MHNSKLKNLLNERDYYNLLNSKFCKSSFAQFGEDLIINKILSKTIGNYLDLGSFHPIFFSNTFLLYLRGWRGVNIDGNKEAIKISKKIRPLDKNIHAFLSDKKQNKYYIKNRKVPAMNRLSDQLDNLNENEDYDIIETKNLNDVIEGHENYLTKLYYLNIDIEFYDEVILKTFNFERYHPLLISIESHSFDFYKKNSICKFLEQHNYSIHSYVKPTAIYVDNDFKKNLSKKISI